MAREILKSDKICLVCGGGFRATGKANTCSGACRIKLARILKTGKRPSFYLIAKHKGQDVPDYSSFMPPETSQESYKKQKSENTTNVETAPKSEENLTYFQKRQRGLI